MSTFINRHTSIPANLIQFCRYLRTKGFTITADEESDALLSFKEILPVTELSYIELLKATLCKNAFQYERFEDLYHSYQFELKKAVDSKIKDAPDPGSAKKPAQLPSFEALKSWLYNKPSEESKDLPTYSDIDVLVKKDFSLLTDEELEYLARMMQQMADSILRRKTRLHKLSRKKTHINLGMTMRKNLRSGTEIRSIVFSEPKLKKLKLVLLCDVSRSMDMYSRFFMQLMYAFQSGYDRIDTFVFSTSLFHISDLLEQNDFSTAFKEVSERVPKWSGGTKIGSSLQDFCREYAHRKLDRKTIVIILSDGWDTGNQDVMKVSIQEINRLSRKIIWLNPLAGHPKFSPEVSGLKTILPYINKLLPAHNLESLKKALHLL